MDNSVDIDIMEYRGYERVIRREPERPKSKAFDSSPGGLVESLITKNKVVIFSKSSCPHCKDSMSLLSDMGVEFTTVELDKMQEGSLVQNTLGQMTNARTVPRIFINGQCVGGNSDLQSLGSSGKLKNLLYAEQERWDEKETLKWKDQDKGYYLGEVSVGSEKGASSSQEAPVEDASMEFVSAVIEDFVEAEGVSVVVDESEEVEVDVSVEVDEALLVEKFEEGFEGLSENNPPSASEESESI